MKATVVPEDCQDRFSRFTNKPLINILNPEVWTEPGNKKILEKTCNDDQILDTFFDVCRKLYCPIFSLSINGRCVPFLDPDVSYELFVRLLPLERIKASQSVKNELGSRYLNIQRKLGFGECKSCSVTMYLNKDALNEVHLPDVYVNFAFKVTRRCKVEQLWSKLTSVEKSSSRIKITLNKEVVSFDALWDNKTYKTFESDYYEEILTVGVSGQCKVLSPQRLANCPKVELTRKEYDTVLENHSGAKGLLFSPSNEETNGSVFVCCDSYIQEQRATGAEKRAPVLLTIIAYFFAVSMTTL
ncbi:uncharacterized protein LOC128549840 [Mercenaria mercenaria]|uniref:uncharacterized protein LOC128549840 n=1 Tax=Mercenaria mercenaria TaxID=6596 RepID=UPI00234F564F|nr:uncharacterized protein LOC128549840 [Mercenaria mercenaria]